MKHRLTSVTEAMSLTRRHDHGLPGHHDGALLPDQNLGAAIERG